VSEDIADGASVRNWKHRTEADPVSATLSALGPYYAVEREGLGHPLHRQTTSALSSRTRSRAPIAQANDFGVEFKNALAGSFDTRRFTSWAAQGVDYVYTEWDGYGRLMIFTCPAVSAAFTSETVYGDGAARLMVRVLGHSASANSGRPSTVGRCGSTGTMSGPNVTAYTANGV
jgi:hypothetical protein